jgi:hypothetical protein
MLCAEVVVVSFVLAQAKTDAETTTPRSNTPTDLKIDLLFIFVFLSSKKFMRMGGTMRLPIIQDKNIVGSSIFILT